MDSFSAPMQPKVPNCPLLLEDQQQPAVELQYEILDKLSRLSKAFGLLLVVMLCLNALTYMSLSNYIQNEMAYDNDELETMPEIPEREPNTKFLEYLEYNAEHGKRYDTRAENLLRIQAYEETSNNIENWNDADTHGDVTYGHNDLSDWTEEEFRKSLLPLSFYQRLHKEAEFIQPIPESMTKTQGEGAGQYPDFFDWRDRNMVTPVKAQGKCGSCWAFASTATVEAAWAIANNGEHRNLSEQTLLDCDFADNACDGGDEDKAFRYIHRNGLAYAADLPYVAHRQNSCSVNSHWNTTRINVAYFIHPDEESIIHWLVNFGPVNIGMSVIQPMRAYKGGVFKPSKEACKNEVIGLHALLITGYGTSEDGEKYWIVKNSWGNTWGVEHGYIYFQRGVNACGIEEEPIGILA